MGFFSQRIKRSDLKAGDHIYTWRKALAYSHHGIYVGNNKIVHFTNDRHLSSSSSSTAASSSSCLDLPKCGFRKEGSGVAISCLSCFLKNGSLRRFEYGVSSIYFIAKLRGGTCTTAESNPPEDVVDRAMYLVEKGFWNYDVYANNCEDFALYCKTGTLVCTKKGEALGCSGQAMSVVGVPLAAAIALPLRLVASNPVVTVMAAALTYSYNRYVTDIGVRLWRTRESCSGSYFFKIDG